MTALATVARPNALRGRVMHRSPTRRGLAFLGAAVAAIGLAVAVPAEAAAPTVFRRIDLVSHQPRPAMITHTKLLNPWGVSPGPNTPLWGSGKGPDLST